MKESVLKVEKSKKTYKVQSVNGFFMTFLYWCIRFFLFLCGVRVKSVNNAGKINGPALVLCNHGSFIDFIYAATLLYKFKPHFIVARLYFYNNFLKWLLKKLGAFPKSMFAADTENAKNCLTVLKNKEILAMMPEARLSTAGQFEDIQENTYAFIKKCNADVYTVKINGDYLAYPKWGKGLRRGAVVEAQLNALYTAEQLQTLSLEEIKKDVNERLYYDEFEWLKTRPKLRYRSPRIAEGLENVLSVCPVCNKKHILTAKGNKIFCENCGFLTELSDRYEFDKNFKFENIAQWYNWQKALLEEEFSKNEDFALISKVELRLPGDGNRLTRHGGYGVCRLDRNGLTYCGTKDGEEVELNFSVQRIYRLLFGAGENFEIYDGTQILYFVPEERRSAVDWYTSSIILHDINSKVRK